MSARRAFVERHRLAQRRHRLFGPAENQQRLAELRLRRPVIRPDRERLLEPLRRLGRPPGLAQRMAEIVGDIGIAGVERGGTAVARDRVVEAAGTPESVGQIAQEARIARRPAHGLGKQRQRRFQLAGLGVEHAEEVQRVRMAGALPQDSLVERRRSLHPPRPMVGERGPQHVVDRAGGNGAGTRGSAPCPPPLASRHLADVRERPDSASKSVMRRVRKARPTRAPTVTGSCTSMLAATYSRLTSRSSASSSAMKAMMTPP